MILSLQQTGLLTKATALREMQRRGVLEASINPDAELSSAEEEAPDLMHEGSSMGGDDDVAQ